MKYILNKKILWINMILCIILIGTIVYLEGISSVFSRTEIISCPEDSYMDCQFTKGQSETTYLKPGETITRNEFNKDNLDKANYGIWIMITISLITNHIAHNRKYPIIKELTKLIKRITNEKD